MQTVKRGHVALSVCREVGCSRGECYLQGLEYNLRLLLEGKRVKPTVWIIVEGLFTFSGFYLSLALTPMIAVVMVMSS